MGKQISPELEADKIYQVYRPAEEIRKAADTFKLVPLVDNHTMIGKDFTPAEEKGVHGVLGEEIKEKDGVLYADVKIFSESLKNLIQNGKKELSLGYFCEYDLTPGEYHGVHYDAVQRSLRGNHIALVDNGRMGHDVRVMDSMAFDALDLDTEKAIKEDLSSENYGVGGKDAAPKKENEMDKREAIREIMAISAKPVSEFAGGEEEKVETIAKLAEKLAYKPSETSKADDACGKDAEVDKRKLIDEISGILKDKVSEEIIRTIMGKAEELAYNKSEAGSANDEDEPKEESKLADKVNEVERSMDELPAKVLKMLADREALYNKVAPLVGAFDHADMTEEQVAQYACDKLDIKDVEKGQHAAVLKGYLKAQKPVQIVSMDAGLKSEEKDAGFEAFLKGEK